MQTRTYVVMDDAELDALVRQNCPAQPNFCYAATVEAVNDTAKAFEEVGTGNMPSLPSDADLFESWAEDGGFRDLVGPRLVLQGLVRRGVLPAGNFLIKASW